MKSSVRISLSIFVIITSGVLFYNYGRVIWHPVISKLNGAHSVGDICSMIEDKKPGLASINSSKLSILIFKHEKTLYVYGDDKKIMEIPILAASGKLGPKLQEGDRQVPEGIYKISSLNPSSSYYLSLKVSYPNADDVSRSNAKGISALGGDIYIHGDRVSIGCIAVGNDKIEDLFYLVNKIGMNNTEVIISPNEIFGSDINHEPVYDKIQSRILQIVTNLTGF